MPSTILLTSLFTLYLTTNCVLVSVCFSLCLTWYYINMLLIITTLYSTYYCFLLWCQSMFVWFYQFYINHETVITSVYIALETYSRFPDPSVLCRCRPSSGSRRRSRFINTTIRRMLLFVRSACSVLDLQWRQAGVRRIHEAGGKPPPDRPRADPAPSLRTGLVPASVDLFDDRSATDDVERCRQVSALNVNWKPFCAEWRRREAKRGEGKGDTRWRWRVWILWHVVHTWKSTAQPVGYYFRLRTDEPETVGKERKWNPEERTQLTLC